MKVLLTGSTGLIGSEMSSYLVGKCDVDLVLFDRERFKKEKSYLTSLTSKKKFDVVINAAGQSKVWRSKKEPISDLDANVGFNVRLLASDILVEGGAFVYFGSDASSRGHYDQFDSPYAISKYAGVHYTKVLAKLYGYRSIILTPSFVVGDHFSRNVLYDALKAHLTDSLSFPKLHPESKWNFIDVKDLVVTTFEYVTDHNGDVDVAIASENNIKYGTILKILGKEPDRFNNFEIIERCLKNTSYFRGHFDVEKFIVGYIEN